MAKTTTDEFGMKTTSRTDKDGTIVKHTAWAGGTDDHYQYRDDHTVDVRHDAGGYTTTKTAMSDKISETQWTTRVDYPNGNVRIETRDGDITTRDDVTMNGTSPTEIKHREINNRTFETVSIDVKLKTNDAGTSVDVHTERWDTRNTESIFIAADIPKDLPASGNMMVNSIGDVGNHDACLSKISDTQTRALIEDVKQAMQDKFISPVRQDDILTHAERLTPNPAANCRTNEPPKGPVASR